MLVYEGLQALLGRVVPIGGSTAEPLSFVMGVCSAGGTKHTHPERSPFTPAQGRWATYLELQDWLAHEGGVPDAWSRTLVGYSQQAVTFGITPAGNGALVLSARRAFANAVEWEQQGDWSPDEPPYQWDTPCWQKAAGYPWDTPVNQAEAFGTSAWAHCVARNLWRLSGFPLGQVWVATDAPRKLVTLSLFRDALRLRPGGTLSVDVGGKFWADGGGAIVTRRFAYEAPRAMFGSSAISNWRARLCLPANVSVDTEWAALAELPAESGYAPRALANWTYNAPVQESPPSVEFQEASVEAAVSTWSNSGAVSWPAAGVLAVTCEVGAETILAWASTIEVPVTVAPGDTATVPDNVKLEVPLYG